MGPYVAINFALVGFFAFAALHHFYLWWLSRRELALLFISVQSGLYALFCPFIILIATATDTRTCQLGLDGRTIMGVLVSLWSVWLLKVLTGIKARIYVNTVTVVLLGVVAVQALGYPLNGTVTDIERIRMSWGEEISFPVHGSPGWWLLPLYLVMVSTDLFILFAAAHLWPRDRVGAGLLILASAVVVVVYAFGIAIDVAGVRLPYLGLIDRPIWIVLVSLIVSREYRHRGDRLAASEQRFRGIFDQTFQFIGLLRPDGTLIEANRTALEFAGVREADVVGKPFWETPWWTHSPALQKRLRDAIAAAAAGDTVHFEVSHLRPDGRVAHVDFSLKPVRNERGEVTLLIPEGHDITERKLAEEAIRASEARLTAVITNSLGVAVQWYDHEGRVVLWNRASEEMFGYSAAEALGKTLDQLIETPDEFQSFLEDLATIRHTGQPLGPTEYTFQRRSGASGVCLSTVFQIPGPNGANWFVCMDVDITERKDREQTLRERETFLRLAQEAAHVGSWEWDILTNRFKWSDELARMHGIDRSEFDGDPATVISFCHPEDVPRLQEAMSESLTNENMNAFECRICRRDNAVRDLWFLGRVHRDERGTPTKVLGVAIDVTERKRAEAERRVLEAQLAQAQKMEVVGRLVGGVAHDFNNLLTVINGYSELLRAEARSDDGTGEMLDGILDAGGRAAALTRQLLTFTRQQVVEPRVLDLNAVVTETERMLQRLIGEDIRLVTVLAPDLARVKADPGQIGQVIMNLAVNARDAMPTGGTLTIETARVHTDGDAIPRPDAPPGHYVALAVSDTGCGMPPEVRARLFEPFFTTKGPGKGTGLGLTTVRAIADESSGVLAVESEIGRGSTFKLYLPALPGTAIAPNPDRDARTSPRGTETILLVEDDDAVRGLTRLILQQSGYSVMEVAVGTEAIPLVVGHSGPIDLLITDVVMPEIGGRQLAERLTGMRPGLKVLYVSGYTDDAVVRHGVSEEEVAFLQKPFTRDALARKVRQTLDAAPAETLTHSGGYSNRP